MTTRERIRVHALIDTLGIGGAETLIAEQAAGAERAGIQLTVGYLREREGSPMVPRLRDLGVEPVPVGLEGRSLTPTALGRVRAHLRAAAPDVLHTHLGTSDVLGPVAARTLGIPAVSTVHQMHWDTGAAGRARTAMMVLSRRTCTRQVVVVSDTARRAYLEQRWDRSGRVVTVHNAVAGRAQPGAGARVREELGLAPDALVVCMLSALRPEKGYELAVDAIARLRPRFPDLRLLVVGDGPERPRVERLVADLDGAGVVAGFRPDVMAVLDASDVVLHPSYIEAFPTTLLEAMAASVPVVASAVGGIVEIVEDGVTGRLVPEPLGGERFADALAPLLEDPGLRAREGAAGRAAFEREFAVERWSERLRSVYEHALGRA